MIDFFAHRNEWQTFPDGREINRECLFIEPRCCTWVAVAVVAAGAITAGATAYSATSASSAQQDAADKQLSGQEATNQSNVALNLAARGAPLYGKYAPAGLKGTQSAILPYYFGGTEAQSGQDAAGLYQFLRDNPGTTVADYKAMASKYAPQIAQTQATANSIVGPGMTNEMLADAQPVFAQRTATAKNAAMDALAKTLGEIDSIQAGKGYGGDSLNSNMMTFSARKQAGTDIGNASLQNSLDTQAIRSAGRQLRINNIGLPDQMLSADVSRRILPKNAAGADFSASLSPFNNFRLSPNNSTVSQPPTAFMPHASGGQFAGQAIGQVASTAGNYFANRSLQAQARAPQFQPYNAPASFGTSGYVPAGVQPTLPAGYNMPPVSTQGFDYTPAISDVAIA